MSARLVGRAVPLASMAAGAAALVFVLWIRFSIGGADVTRAVDDIAECVAPALAALACAAVAWRAATPTSRRGWALLGASAFSWGAGQVVWSVYELGLHRDVPFPSLADVGYLAAIPFAVAGMLTLATRSADVQTRLRSFMDGLVITTALFFISWSLVMRTVVDASSGPLLQQAIAFAYPLGDVIAGTIAIYTVARVPAHAKRPVYLVTFAILAMAFADSGFAYFTTTGDYATGNLIDVGWFAGYLLLGIGALDALARREAGDAEAAPLTLGAAIVPYVPFGASLIVAAYEIGMRTVDSVMEWTAIFLVLFIVTRQLLHIVDHMELSSRLASANAELRRVEAFRAQLLNNVSHDLATPLTPILLQLHVLAQRELGATERHSLDVMKRNAEQLQRLVADVKDVARLEAGNLRVVATDADVSSIVRASVESFHDVASERGIRLDLLVEEPLPARADAQRLTQVVFNLLTNALKFTPRDGWVLVRARRERGDIVVDVADSGRGIALDDQSKLFQPFVQVHDPSKMQEKGTGLGLYISRGIMRQHSGELTCASPGVGQGSTFTLRLPMRPIEAKLAPKTA